MLDTKGYGSIRNVIRQGKECFAITRRETNFRKGEKAEDRMRKRENIRDLPF